MTDIPVPGPAPGPGPDPPAEVEPPPPPVPEVPAPEGRSDEDQSPGEAAFLRDLFDRSWEMELLIAGAVVFALFQAPAALDRAWLRWDAVAGSATSLSGFFVYYYFKLIVYTLLATFLMQLAVRAYWVGLLGLHGVFPDGPNWEKVRQGPHSRRAYQGLFPSGSVQIRRADSLASVLFAAGFSIVGIFLWSIVGVAVLGALTLLITGLFFGGQHGGRVFWTLFIGVNAFLVLPQLVDRVIGARLREDGRFARFIRGVARVGWVTGLRIYIPTWVTISSNVRSRAPGVAIPVIIAGLVGYFMVSDVLIPQGRLRTDGGVFFPDLPTPFSVDPNHYDDRGMLGPARARAPSIPSELIEAGLVRLFLPYRPAADDELMAEICPTSEPLRGDRPRIVPRGAEGPDREVVESALACMSRLWRVRLNGVEIPAPEFSFARRDPNDQPGLLTYLPIDGLPSGRHVIEVDALVGLEDADDGDRRDSPPAGVGSGSTQDGAAGLPDVSGADWRTYYIPFWK